MLVGTSEYIINILYKRSKENNVIKVLYLFQNTTRHNVMGLKIVYGSTELEKPYIIKL